MNAMQIHAAVVHGIGQTPRYAAQLARGRGARTVVAGRNQRVLDQLMAYGADATIRVDRPRDELAAAITAEGPDDLIID
jgi:D-arabinose 1-dehydrogenase-like Zn-dependent alcohol dehydrogenase